jgi:hypothetical protein
MAVSDPLVITIAGSAKSLNKINQDSFGSEFLLRESLAEYRAKIRHSTTKPDANGRTYDRHNFEVTITTFAAGAVPEYHRKFYFVDEVLPSATDVDMPDAVADLMIASTDAFLLKLLTWQS